MRNAQRRAFEIDRPHVTTFYQTRQHKASALDVVSRMREIIVSTNQINHLPVTLENAHRLTDSLSPNRKSGNQRLFEHGNVALKGLRQPYTKWRLPPNQKCLSNFPTSDPFAGRDHDV